MFTSLLLLQTSLACILQFAGIGSAGLLFFSAFPLFIFLVLNALFMRGGEISLWTYALTQFIPLISGTQVLAATLDVFVPLVCLGVSLDTLIPHESFVRRRDALVPKRQLSILLPV
jgi:hypothetical protein